MIQLYAVYNKLTLEPKTQEAESEKKRPHESSNWKRNGVNILISDKIRCWDKTCYNRQRILYDKESIYQ